MDVLACIVAILWQLGLRRVLFSRSLRTKSEPLEEPVGEGASALFCFSANRVVLLVTTWSTSFQKPAKVKDILSPVSSLIRRSTS